MLEPLQTLLSKKTRMMISERDSLWWKKLRSLKQIQLSVLRLQRRLRLRLRHRCRLQPTPMCTILTSRNITRFKCRWLDGLTGWDRVNLTSQSKKRLLTLLCKGGNEIMPTCKSWPPGIMSFFYRSTRQKMECLRRRTTMHSTMLEYQWKLWS